MKLEEPDYGLIFSLVQHVADYCYCEPNTHLIKPVTQKYLMSLHRWLEEILTEFGGTCPWFHAVLSNML